ncbi:MAG: WbqC family protein [Deltaproteobacteria bacterium]|nr:WbqC family protein [Deltaproteobacteria bacterium]MBU2677659.1 WbqC family protein [Gammaproteobacteria bacterium]NNL51391.1 WbqC family protein [Woeseiaceae bacterium]
MKLAIMQPYFFPYIGYWQLLNAADRFVVYDDVNFIRGGWINRNRILINGKPSYITAALDHASQNKRICDISLQDSPLWRTKMIKSIENTYRRSPFFSAVMPDIDEQIGCQAINLAEFLVYHLNKMAKVLGINTEIVSTSRDYQNSNLAGQDRILDICRREGATSYINLPGGQALYDSKNFENANIDLCFLSMRIAPYKQRTADFVPNLSVIDALMEVGTEGVGQRLGEFELTAVDDDFPGTTAIN